MTTASRTKKSNDFTGRQAEALAAAAAEEQRSKAEEVAMITAQRQQDFEDTVYDVSGPSAAPVVVDEVLEMGVILADDTVVVRLAEDIENMTYGAGNIYTFKAGGRYKVPRGVAERLEELGLLYERL